MWRSFRAPNHGFRDRLSDALRAGAPGPVIFFQVRKALELPVEKPFLVPINADLVDRLPRGGPVRRSPLLGGPEDRPEVFGAGVAVRLQLREVPVAPGSGDFVSSRRPAIRLAALHGSSGHGALSDGNPWGRWPNPSTIPTRGFIVRQTPIFRHFWSGFNRSGVASPPVAACLISRDGLMRTRPCRTFWSRKSCRFSRQSCTVARQRAFLGIATGFPIPSLFRRSGRGDPKRSYAIARDQRHFRLAHEKGGAWSA